MSELPDTRRVCLHEESTTFAEGRVLGRVTLFLDPSGLPTALIVQVDGERLYANDELPPVKNLFAQVCELCDMESAKNRLSMAIAFQAAAGGYLSIERVEHCGVRHWAVYAGNCEIDLSIFRGPETDDTKALFSVVEVAEDQGFQLAMYALANIPVVAGNAS